MTRRTCLVMLAILSTAGPAWTTEAVDDAIRRAVPYVRERGSWWIDEKGCASCHRTTFTTWTLSAARRAGFDVDGDEVAEWERWNRESMLEPVEGDEEGAVAGTKNLEGVAQVVWSRHLAQPRSSDEDAVSQLVALLLDGQGEDGTWKANGQLPAQRRPERETMLVSTAWIALALGTQTTEAARAAHSRALEALSAEKDGQSTEWAVTRLLLAVQSGDERQVADGTARLRAAQRESGGWGWLLQEEGDAFGTGLVLHALGRAGVPAGDEALQRGVQFLVSTQEENGSWPVPGTKRNAKGRVVETARYWGTCWAVLGLLESRRVD